MPAFSVSVTTCIEIATNIEVTAKNDEAAQEKVQKMLDDGKLSFTWTHTAKEPLGESEEQGQEHSIESCDEA